MDSTKFLARVLLFCYVVEMVSFRRVVLLLLFVSFFTASLFGYVWYRLFSAETLDASPLYGIKTIRVIKITCGEERAVRTMLFKERDGLLALGGFWARGWPKVTKEGRRKCSSTREAYRRVQAGEESVAASDSSTPYYDALYRNTVYRDVVHHNTPYLSFPGWDSLLLYPFWRLSQAIFAESPDRLYLGLWTLRVVSALSTALVLWLLCWWMVREVGLSSGLFVGAGMILFPIMSMLLYTVGQNPMHKPLFYFVPFLMVAFALQSRWRQRTSTRLALPVVAGLAGLGVACKVLFGFGYDQLPTTMVAATVPVFWYAVRERWSLRQFSLWFGCCSLAILAGFALAFVIHGLQMEAIGVDFLGYAKDRFLFRAHGFDDTGNALRCEDAQAFKNLSWKMSRGCVSLFSVVFDGFRYQIPFLVLCLLCFSAPSVRADCKARWKAPRFRALFQATLVCVGIGAVAAVSQPLIWTQGTAVHLWLKVCSWLIVFRPFALLALALLLEPTLLRWSSRVMTMWQQRVDAS